MKSIIFENKHSLVRTSDFERTKKKLALEITKIKESISKAEKGYDAINLAKSKEMLSVLKLAKDKQQLDISAVIVIGIGGSNLGTMAVYEALRGKFCNIKESKKLFFADTTDSDTIFEIRNQMDAILKSGKNVLLNLISKSGNTTESIANFEVLFEVLKKQRKDYKKYVVFTTDKNSLLEILGKKEGFDILNVPQNVGGRYSVFSPVGLFPLAMMNIDVKKLLRGAGSLTDKCLSKDISKNPSALGALDLYCNYREGKAIHDVFFFSNDLESTGKWYRQLLAESLGKKYSKTDARVNEGITPTVSIGSTDLHSMAQLYLGGPANKFTTFIKVIPKQKEKIPKMKEYGALVSGIQGKKLSDIMDAIFSGTKIAYIKGGRPFNQITLGKDEYSIGQYLQYEMIKVIMLGHLMNVNPFDQPAVEQYKEETRKILGK
jgi:glucose-6-phosphate isomerase